MSRTEGWLACYAVDGGTGIVAITFTEARRMVYNRSACQCQLILTHKAGDMHRWK